MIILSVFSFSGSNPSVSTTSTAKPIIFYPNSTETATGTKITKYLHRTISGWWPGLHGDGRRPWRSCIPV